MLRLQEITFIIRLIWLAINGPNLKKLAPKKSNWRKWWRKKKNPGTNPGHRQKREKQVIDHSTGDKNKMILFISITLLIVTFSVIIISKIKL